MQLLLFPLTIPYNIWVHYSIVTHLTDIRTLLNYLVAIVVYTFDV